MIIAKIAAYIIAVVAILGLSVKFLWLFFILFTYRTYASIVTFDWFQQIGLNNHFIYFIAILTLSIGTYALLLRYTEDLKWIRLVVLSLLMFWVFKNYSFQDIFLLRDYLEARGMWDINWYYNQIKEIFKTGPEGFSNLFSSVFGEAFDAFRAVFDGISEKVK